MTSSIQKKEENNFALQLNKELPIIEQVRDIITKAYLEVTGKQECIDSQHQNFSNLKPGDYIIKCQVTFKKQNGMPYILKTMNGDIEFFNTTHTKKTDTCGLNTYPKIDKFVVKLSKSFAIADSGEHIHLLGFDCYENINKQPALPSSINDSTKEASQNEFNIIAAIVIITTAITFWTSLVFKKNISDNNYNNDTPPPPPPNPYKGFFKHINPNKRFEKTEKQPEELKKALISAGLTLAAILLGGKVAFDFYSSSEDKHPQEIKHLNQDDSSLVALQGICHIQPPYHCSI